MKHPTKKWIKRTLRKKARKLAKMGWDRKQINKATDPAWWLS